MILLLLAALLAPSAAGPQQKPAETFELDSFTWRAEATPQRVIFVTNEWGDLRVRTSVRGVLDVSAMIQKIGTRRDEFHIRIDERSDTVVVKVEPLTSRPRGRVDLTVMIPPGKRVEGTTRDGLAELKYNGEVQARTRGGAIAIDTPSHATARTRTGHITAKLTGEAWRQPLALTSESGDITVWLSEQASLVLRADTGGDLQVAFPDASVQRRGDASRVETKIGQGGAVLRVETGTGDVRVLTYTSRRPPA